MRATLPEKFQLYIGALANVSGIVGTRATSGLITISSGWAFGAKFSVAVIEDVFAVNDDVGGFETAVKLRPP